MKIMQSSLWTFALALGFTLLAGGCDRGLKIRYQYDGSGLVETVSVRSGDSIVAVAKRLSIRSAGGPTVTDIQVEETHFAPGTQEVVYKGKMVFRCRTNEPFGERITDTPLSGTRPQDVFRRWPYATAPFGG